MADRYTYVPYVGLLFIIGSVWSGLVTGRRACSPPARYALVGVAIAIAVVFAAVTFERTRVWKDSETLWTDVIEKYDDVPIAYNNRGNVYLYERGRIEQALTDYNRALALKPDYTEAYYNRGNLYNHVLKEYDLALADFSAAVGLDPEHARAHNNLGTLYNRKKDCLRALEHYDRAITLSPDNGQYRLNRSLCHSTMGDNPRALDDALAARRLGATVDEAYLSALKE